MNVLFFMTDQHHADCLSLMGHPLVKTPNLDRLASRGVVFNRMFTCSAICSPSRTSFFTGAYLRTHQHFCNKGDLRRPMPSLVEELRNNGYYTGQCGKNHLPESLFNQFHHCWTHNQQNQELKQRGQQECEATDSIKKNLYSFKSQLPEADSKEAWTAERAIDFLQSEEANDSPFFLWCSFERPHPPISPPASFDDLYNADDIPLDWEGYRQFEASRLQNRPMIEDFWKIGSFRQNPGIFQKALCRYFSLITLIDQEIGRVLQTLESQGQAEQTLIVFTADHGDWAGHWGQFGKNLPGYDDLLHIPFHYCPVKVIDIYCNYFI